MAKDTNTNSKKPKFNSWWIYGIIAVLLIGFQFLGSDQFSNTKKTTSTELQTFLRNGDVDKIIIITNTKQAKIFLTEEALKKDIHKLVAEKPFSLTARLTPDYVSNFWRCSYF